MNYAYKHVIYHLNTSHKLFLNDANRILSVDNFDKYFTPVK